MPDTKTNLGLQSRRDAAFARGLGNQLPVYVDRARNAELWDVEGRRYIDFGSGIAVLNTGHLHPKVQAAAAAQLERFSHTCLMVTPYESATVTVTVGVCGPSMNLTLKNFACWPSQQVHRLSV